MYVQYSTIHPKGFHLFYNYSLYFSTKFAKNVFFNYMWSMNLGQKPPTCNLFSFFYSTIVPQTGHSRSIYTATRSVVAKSKSNHQRWIAVKFCFQFTDFHSICFVLTWSAGSTARKPITASHRYQMHPFHMFAGTLHNGLAQTRLGRLHKIFSLYEYSCL